MFIDERIKILADEFLNELKTAEQNAKTEAQFDELVEICEEVLSRIPITLIQKDYYTRTSLRTWMSDFTTDEEKRSEYISKIMTGLYDLDTIKFDDYIYAVIRDDIEKLEKSKEA